MGRGIAKQFKTQYPMMYEHYKEMCRLGNVKIGNVYGFEENGRLIINFPTKYHWRQPSKIEYIQSGLLSLVEFINKFYIKSIAMPALGCGCGGLNWYQVKMIICNILKEIDYYTDIYIYNPK